MPALTAVATEHWPVLTCWQSAGSAVVHPRMGSVGVLPLPAWPVVVTGPASLVWSAPPSCVALVVAAGGTGDVAGSGSLELCRAIVAGDVASAKHARSFARHLPASSKSLHRPAGLLHGPTDPATHSLHGVPLDVVSIGAAFAVAAAEARLVDLLALEGVLLLVVSEETRVDVRVVGDCGSHGIAPQNAASRPW